MHIDEFRRLFADNIRALVAWDRLHDSAVTISERVVADRAALGELRTVWYRSDEGGLGDWRDPTSVPMSVSEAVTHRDIWTRDRSDRIEAFGKDYQRYAEPVVMVIPAYETPLGALMLDATHRVVAAYLANVEVRLLVLGIEGPLSAEVLPDLTHHGSPTKSATDAQ